MLFSYGRRIGPLPCTNSVMLMVGQIAAEILANMACVVRNSFLDVVQSNSSNSGGGYEWPDDGDDSERKMNDMAASSACKQHEEGRIVGRGSEVSRVWYYDILCMCMCLLLLIAFPFTISGTN